MLDASASRARPVFLGAATTVLGVAPLLVDPFFRSMAVTIMFGLIFATGLTLVVVPLLYASFFRIRGDGDGGGEMRRVPLPGRLLHAHPARTLACTLACPPACACVFPGAAAGGLPARRLRATGRARARKAGRGRRRGRQEQDAASLGTLPWKEILPAPELHTLIEEALVANADLRIAIERIELARAQYGIERAALFPGVNASAAATRERMPGFDPRENQVGESTSIGLSMPVWEIDLWGRLAARTEAARRAVLANAALADGVRTSLIAEVASLYLELLDLDAQHEITLRTLNGRRKALRLTRARLRSADPRCAPGRSGAGNRHGAGRPRRRITRARTRSVYCSVVTPARSCATPGSKT